MKIKFLLPPYFKLVGAFLAIPGFILGYLVLYQDFKIAALSFNVRAKGSFFLPKVEDFTNETALALVLVGLLLMTFSREKREDELVTRLRFDALYWAVLINGLGYLLLLSLTWAFGIFGDDKLNVYNSFTPLLIFLARFHYLLHFRRDTYIVPQLRFLPHRPYRWLGICLTLLAMTLLAYQAVFDRELRPGIQNLEELAALGGLLLWAFSENKSEDELTTQYRLESVLLAVLVNYGLLLVANFAVYSFGFLLILFINTFSLLLFFVVRFAYLTYSNAEPKSNAVKGGLLV